MLRPLLLAFVTLSSATLLAQNSPAFTAADAAALLAQPDATAEALHDTGDLAYRAKAYDAAFKLFQRAADLGHTPSMRRVAQLHLYGQGTPRDQPKARETYLAAARLGDAIAMNEFASMAARGWNGPQDAPAAIEWATRAVAAGNHAAISVLGSIYENGLGVPRDLAKAIEWYDQGADKNNVYKDSALRLREAARTTPEQKLAAYETALREAEQHNNPSLARGHAVANYLRALYDGGLSPEEAAARFRPELEKLVATDFHAVAQGMRLATATLSEPVQAFLSADQRLVVRQINFPRSFSTAAEIQPGQGWSAIYSADKRPAAAAPAAVPAVAATPAPRPAAPAATPAPAVAAKNTPRPAAPAAASTAELSAVTREAKNWQEFFAASAKRPEVFHQRHEPDVALFLRRHAATPEQLRTAYRAAHAGLRLTVGSDRGREAGAQFVAYQTALLQAGLSDAEAVAYVRDDFLKLLNTDIYNAYQALMGVRDAAVAPLRTLIPSSLQQEFRDLAARHANREPVPKVGAAVAASSAPPDSLVGHWSYSASTFSQNGRPSQRIEGVLRFDGGGHVVNSVVFGPLSANPTRDSAHLSGEHHPLTGHIHRTLRFNQGELVFDSTPHPQNLAGNIWQGQNIIGSWQAVRRLDLDHVARARSLGSGPEAIAAYTEAIKLRADPAHYFARGNLHYDARNNEAAIADYDVVLKTEPRHANARFNRMLALYYARQHERALTEVDHLLKNKMLQGEQLADAHFMRGQILWWLKRHDESEAAYAAAIKLAPKFAERTRVANTREGRLAEIVERGAEVNAIFARMDEGIKKSTDQLRAANAALLASRQPAQAPAAAPAAAGAPLVGPATLTPSHEPDRALEATLPQLGEAWEEARGRPEHYAQLVDELIRRYPQRIEPLVAKAQILSGRTPDRADARALLERAFALDPLHPQIHLGLAQLDIAEGERARALRRMREMAVLRPRSLSLAVFEANLLNELRAPADERRAMRARLASLIQAAPPDDRGPALHASVYLALGAEDHESALADLNAAMALRRQPAPDLILQRAQLHERLKDYPSALADYQQLLDGPAGKNSRQAAQLRARIAAVRQAMDTETARLRDETAKIDVGLERVREANSPEARQRIGDRMGAAMDFVAGNRAFEAGDIAKARELWTKAAAAGHEEAAARLKTLPPPQP